MLVRKKIKTNRTVQVVTSGEEVGMFSPEEIAEMQTLMLYYTYNPTTIIQLQSESCSVDYSLVGGLKGV